MARCASASRCCDDEAFGVPRPTSASLSPPPPPVTRRASAAFILQTKQTEISETDRREVSEGKGSGMGKRCAEKEVHHVIGGGKKEELRIKAKKKWTRATEIVEEEKRASRFFSLSGSVSFSNFLLSPTHAQFWVSSSSLQTES